MGNKISRTAAFLRYRNYRKYTCKGTYSVQRYLYHGSSIPGNRAVQRLCLQAACSLPAFYYAAWAAMCAHARSAFYPRLLSGGIGWLVGCWLCCHHRTADHSMALMLFLDSCCARGLLPHACVLPLYVLLISYHYAVILLIYDYSYIILVHDRPLYYDHHDYHHCRFFSSR